MDPRQRLLLTVGYEAFHSAQYNKESLLNQQIGVYVRIDANENHCIELPFGPYSGTGQALSIVIKSYFVHVWFEGS